MREQLQSHYRGLELCVCVCVTATLFPYKYFLIEVTVVRLPLYDFYFLLK